MQSSPEEANLFISPKWNSTQVLGQRGASKDSSPVFPRQSGVPFYHLPAEQWGPEGPGPAHWPYSFRHLC